MRRAIRGLGYTSAAPLSDGTVVVTTAGGNQIHTQAACVSTVGTLADGAEGYFAQLTKMKKIAIGGAIAAGVIGYFIGKH